MSDLQLLFLVLALLYGWECACWVGRGSVAIRSWLGRRWRITHPGTLLGNQRGGFVFAHPLPPLGTLDNLISNSMAFGFVFITLGLVAGSAWAFIESGTDWIRDPRIALSFITWGFYLAMVFLRASAGWRGRKAALMAVAVLCCSALTWAAHVGLRSMLTK